jgi:hypothetical protein
MSNKMIYMLREDGDESGSCGPFLGEPGLDIDALAQQFRAQQYAEAESKQDDYCWLSDGDFIAWLIAEGHLTRAEHTTARYTLSTSGEHRYIPAHWPLCPQCNKGRGDDTPGPVSHGLNRWDWWKTCTSCGHVWGHYSIPHRSNEPILDDDGRDLHNGCVPYSLSQATGLPMPEVVEVCRKHGWRDNTGMYSSDAIVAARDLGFHLNPINVPIQTGQPTLRRTLDQLPKDKKYIVCTDSHWLAIINGQNRDQSDTSMRRKVLACWEVQPAQ